MSDAEIIKLVLDMEQSGRSVQEINVALQQLNATMAQTANTYDIVGDASDTFAISTSHVETALDRETAAAVENTRAQRLLAAALEVTDKKQDAVASNSKATASRILELGRATQDFAQGGFAGIINNIERIVGGGGLAAGILTAVGTAALVAAPSIKEYFRSFGDGSQKIPEADNALQKYTDTISKNKKAIEDLKAAESLDFFQLQEYKRLVHETEQAEEKLADARAARSVTGFDSKADHERAAAFRAALGEAGGGELMAEQLSGNKRAGFGDKQDVYGFIAAALKGDKNSIKRLTRASPALAGNYDDPELKAIGEKNKADQEEIGRINKKEAEDALRKAEKADRAKANAQKEAIAEAEREYEEGQAAAAKAKADAQKAAAAEAQRQINFQQLIIRSNKEMLALAGENTESQALILQNIQQAQNMMRQLQANQNAAKRQAAQFDRMNQPAANAGNGN